MAATPTPAPAATNWLASPADWKTLNDSTKGKNDDSSDWNAGLHDTLTGQNYRLKADDTLDIWVENIGYKGAGGGEGYLTKLFKDNKIVFEGAVGNLEVSKITPEDPNFVNITIKDKSNKEWNIRLKGHCTAPGEKFKSFATILKEELTPDQDWNEANLRNQMTTILGANLTGPDANPTDALQRLLMQLDGTTSFSDANVQAQINKISANSIDTKVLADFYKQDMIISGQTDANKTFDTQVIMTVLTKDDSGKNLNDFLTALDSSNSNDDTNFVVDYLKADQTTGTQTSETKKTLIEVLNDGKHAELLDAVKKDTTLDNKTKQDLGKQELKALLEKENTDIVKALSSDDNLEKNKKAIIDYVDGLTEEEKTSADIKKLMTALKDPKCEKLLKALRSDPDFTMRDNLPLTTDALVEIVNNGTKIDTALADRIKAAVSDGTINTTKIQEIVDKIYPPTENKNPSSGGGWGNLNTPTGTATNTNKFQSLVDIAKLVYGENNGNEFFNKIIDKAKQNNALQKDYDAFIALNPEVGGDVTKERLEKAIKDNTLSTLIDQIEQNKVKLDSSVDASTLAQLLINQYKGDSGGGGRRRFGSGDSSESGSTGDTASLLQNIYDLASLTNLNIDSLDKAVSNAAKKKPSLAQDYQEFKNTHAEDFYSTVSDIKDAINAVFIKNEDKAMPAADFVANVAPQFDALSSAQKKQITQHMEKIFRSKNLKKEENAQLATDFWSMADALGITEDLQKRLGTDAQGNKIDKQGNVTQKPADGATPMLNPDGTPMLNPDGTPMLNINGTMPNGAPDWREMLANSPVIPPQFMPPNMPMNGAMPNMPYMPNMPNMPTPFGGEAAAPQADWREMLANSPVTPYSGAAGSTTGFNPVVPSFGSASSFSPYSNSLPPEVQRMINGLGGGSGGQGGGGAFSQPNSDISQSQEALMGWFKKMAV